MKKWGIDISAYQGSYDMQRAKQDGIDFVVIRGGGGDGGKSGNGLYVDSKFICNYNNAKKYGIPCGVYWFSHALTTDDAVREAEYCYNKILRGKKFELPVYLDIEHQDHMRIGRRALTDVIIAFCDYLEKRGYFVGVYSGLYFFQNYMIDSELTRYTHWVACWGSSCNYPYTSCYGMWQFGGGTENRLRSPYVAGQAVDQNYMFVDFPRIIKSAGLNGYTVAQDVKAKEEKVKEEKVTEEKKYKTLTLGLIQDVVAGKYGNGKTRKDMLTQAGYNYDDVQAAVNAYIRAQSDRG